MRFKTLLSVVALSLLIPFSRAADVFYFPQIGDGVVGSIQFRTSFIFVSTGEATTIRVEFFRSETDAEPLVVTLLQGEQELGTDSVFDIPLAKGASIALETAGTGAIAVGYARVTVATNGDVGGTAVFTRADDGVVLYEAGVPAVKELNDFTIFVDTVGTRNTGLALVNVADGQGASPSQADREVTLNLFGTDATSIATTNVPLGPGRHLPRFVPELFKAVPEAAEMRGSVTVSSSDPLVAVTLRTQDVESSQDVLTTFPVVKGRASQIAGTFSQLATGNVVVSLDLGSVEQPISRIIYRLYSEGALLREWVRRVESSHVVSQVLQVPGVRGRIPTVDRVDVELIGSGGERGPTTSFHLN